MKPSWDEVHTAYGPAPPPGSSRATRRPAPIGEDLAQEVAMALVRALPAFRGEASLKTYVLRIAHNVSLRHVMRDRRWKVDPIDEITDSAVSAEHRAMQREEGTRLLAAIRELPVGLRQALTLALEELPQREIAEVLGVTENAVAIRMHAGATVAQGPAGGVMSEDVDLEALGREWRRIDMKTIELALATGKLRREFTWCFVLMTAIAAFIGYALWRGLTEAAPGIERLPGLIGLRDPFRPVVVVLPPAVAGGSGGGRAAGRPSGRSGSGPSSIAQDRTLQLGQPTRPLLRVAGRA